ncbi:hypothetical protein ACFXCZ_27335 [Streptomyces sp. NPDC059396]|uniref:hypothetical protein n=1 Tax=Streptomyces sp. NPDC059396 TaxID=3346819 RepID=UPI00369EBA4B
MTQPLATAELSPVLDFLAAITEMLDVPRPDNFDDEGAYYRLLESRAGMLCGYLGHLVEQREEPDNYAAGIRKMTASRPVTYAPYSSPEDGEAAPC